MKIEQNILDNLFEIYKETLEVPEGIIEKAPFETALQYIEANLAGHFDWEELSQAQTNASLVELLKTCLIVQDNRLTFDSLAASAALINLQQTFEEAGTLYLARDVDDTGIQEKYLKSQLSSQEPLTELDIKRFISNTGMNQTIQVTNLNEQDIGLILHAARIKHQQDNSPYSIAIMVNAGSEGVPPSPQWLSVSITVDPLSQAITYKANSAQKLTESQRVQIENKLKNAIKFEATPPVSGDVFEAFPRAARVSGNIVSHDAGKARGYKVLHELYMDDAISDAVANNDSARLFAEIAKEDLKAVKQAVYKVQLESIRIGQPEAGILDPQMTENFDLLQLGKMKPEILQAELNLFDAAAVGREGQHPLVVERLSELQLYNKKTSFPGQEPESPLTSVDYQQYLLLVNEKFKNAGVDITLDEMVISCYDMAALDGLLAYSETNQPVPFQALTLNIDNLDLDDEQVRKSFMFNLKSVLLALSDNHLSTLKLMDTKNQFTQEMVKELSDFVVARPVAIEITLPEAFQNSPEAQKIDEAVSDHIRQKNMDDLGQKATARRDAQEVKTEVRQRPRLSGKQSLSIDIELQQEQQVEVAVEAGVEHKEDAAEPEPGEADFYSLFEFQDMLSRSQLDSRAKSYLVNSFILNVTELWLNWTGSLTVTEAINPAKGVKISKTACEELLRHKDKFQFGLDFNRLPPGFVLKKEGQTQYLHFDENLKRIAQYNPLQVQTTELPEEKPLTHSQFRRWLDTADEANPIKAAWNRLNSADYNKEAHQAFKRFLPQMLLLNEEQLGRLFAVSFTHDNHLKTQQFQFLLENASQLKEVLASNPDDTNVNKVLTDLFADDKAQATAFINHYTETMPAFDDHLLNDLIGDNESLRAKINHLTETVSEINLNALLQLYVQFGEKGIEQLTQLVDADTALFNQLNALVFAHTKTYTPLLSEAYQDAMNAIKGFSSNEKLWWDTLLEQHCAAQTDVNLIDAVNAFKAFKERLRELPTPDGQPLTLPDSCAVTGVKSLPVALSRILTLLEHSNEQNRVAQWQEVDKLDLSSRGVIKLASKVGAKRWAFITPEMNINPEHEMGNELYGNETEYEVPDSWRYVGVRDTEAMQQAFFRFVACQEKNGQLPLEFYRYAHKALGDSGLSDEVQIRLHTLIAAATTGVENVSTMNLVDAKKDVDHLIELFKKTPLPSITPEAIKENVRNSLLGELTDLNEIPPLPVLNRLVSLISSSLSNPIKIAINGPRLNQASLDLNRQVEIYGSSVYEGMRDYAPADYENAELFFNHMAMVNAIADELDYNELDAQLLMKMLSSFRFTPETLNPILTDHFVHAAEADRPRRNEALLLLAKLSTREHPELRSLRPDDFITILQEVKTNPKPVVDVLKELQLSDGQALAAYFPDDLLDRYGQAGIPEDVEQKITENFNEKQQAQISRLLLRFSAPGDSLVYGELVDKIIAITKPLNAIEKNIFIAKLTGTQGLYTDERPLGQEGHPFIKLLDTIIANGSPDEFINLIATERHLLRHSSDTQVESFFIDVGSNEKAIEHLSQKATLYLRAILPKIREIDDLAISQVDLTPRLHEVILKTPVEQLTKESAVVSYDKEPFDRQEESLENVLQALTNGRKIDFRTTETITDNFIQASSVADLKSFEQYRDTVKAHAQNKKVSYKDLHNIAKNPAMALLVLYMISPENLSESQRQLFEERYQDKIANLIEQYPAVAMHKDLTQALLLNPEFMNALGERDALEAASSPELLEDDAKLGRVFEALDKDLKEVAAFKKQTTDLQRELGEKKAELKQYPAVFVSLYKKINSIAIENPGSKKQFLELYDRYLAHYSPEEHGELLKYLTDFTSTLEKAFAQTADKNIVLSLCLQFNSDTDEQLQPEGLLRLLEAVDTVPEEYQTTVLKIAIALINNEKDYTIEDFKDLCSLTREHPEFAESLADIYKKAPFPTLNQVLREWHPDATNSDNYAERMRERYNAYNKAPCHRELLVNGFHVEKAREQLRQFDGFDPNLIDLEAFKAKTDEMREKTSDELLSILAKYNPDKETYDAGLAEDYDTLVAAAAELFHRSKGKDEVDVNGEYALGSSMEINTTQYLAILSSLKTPGHVTSQIGTGEGKSRIMMISIACQHAMGKTVDFVTSDAQLATRDFVEYQAYFDMIGARTSMIFAHTDPSLYQKGGINFSDPSNLSLFRNKARSIGQGHLVIAEDEQKRCLLLDEADKTYFDVADTRFNFSKEGDENIRGMSWVYPLLMEYFAQEQIQLSSPLNGKTSISPLDLYYEDVDLSREKFLQFASGRCAATDLMRLKALSNEQIEQWQVSAVTASQLKFNEDFVIEPDVLISTPAGPKISSEAQLLFANRVSKSSKFSFGVHQCLHARLNLARNNLGSVADDNLRTALTQCEQAFYIPDEKQIVYSTTSKNLLDDYAKSTLKAVTGTSGSIIEREEARELYGLDSGDDVTPMHFIDVPRARGIHRKDRAIRLTGSQKQQIDALVEQIKQARAQNQPILIIAENDEESAFLFQKLTERFKDDTKLQHIHSQLSSKDEKARTDIAGEPGQITVSTDMIGRGTDISLKGAAKTHGLNVMVTYLPRPRDLAQIVGRSGRFGAKGETSLVLDKQRLKKALGKTTLTDGFYKNTEAYIQREQALMDRRKQCERLIKNTVGDFRKSLTNAFFENMLKNTDKKDYKTLLPVWTAFFDKSDKAWNEQWPHIQKALAAESIDVAKVKSLFAEYEGHVQKMWDTLRRNIQDVDVVCTDGQKPVDKLPEKVPHLTLSEKTKALLTSDFLSKYRFDKPRVYDHYDPGHEGRAVTYSHWSIPVIASLKGYANLLPGVHFSEARRPFANTRAWLEGRGRLFPELRASKNKGKIIGAGLLGLLGAAAGAALVLTGVLAPLGLTLWGMTSVATSALIMGAGGLAAGAAIGTASGAVVDMVNNRESKVAQPDKDIGAQELDTQVLPEVLPDVHESYALFHERRVADVHNHVQAPDHEDEDLQEVREEDREQRHEHEEDLEQRQDNREPERDSKLTGDRVVSEDDDAQRTHRVQ